MRRYIDANKVSEMIQAKADTLIEGKEAFLCVARWLDMLPAADVVNVVRCKDCQYASSVLTFDGNRAEHRFACCFDTSGGFKKSDGFCSDGRKTFETFLAELGDTEGVSEHDLKAMYKAYLDK